MTAFGFCCFWPGKNTRSRHQADIDRRGTVSPVDESPDAICALEATEELEWHLGQNDQECLVKCGDPLLGPGEQATPYSDSPSCGVPELKGKGHYMCPDSPGAAGSGVASSSSLTEPLIESCSVDGCSSSDNEEHEVALLESYHWEDSSNPHSTSSERKIEGSRFVSMDTSSTSTSEFDNSLLVMEPSAAQELEHAATESMSVHSGWSTIHDSSVYGGDIPPVHRFREGQIPFDRDDASSHSDRSSAPCLGDQANELEDAINFALRDVEGLSGSKQKLGAHILAALRNLKASYNVRGGRPPQPPCCDCEAPLSCSDSTRPPPCDEGSSGREPDLGMSDKGGTSCRGLERDLMAWISNSIQKEEREEERGVSIASRGTSIILPVPLHNEEQESIDLVALQNACENSAIGRELLLHLENTKWRSPSPSSASAPSRASSPPSGPIEPAAEVHSQSSGSDNMIENDMCSPLASDLVCENESKVDPLLRSESVHQQQAGHDQTDGSLLFDTEGSLVNESRRHVHDSAGTMVACNLGTTGCSSMSHLSERPGASWLSSDACPSLCLQPSLPLFVEEGTPEEPEDPPGAMMSASRGKKPSSDGSSLENFYDCLPDLALAEAKASPESTGPEAAAGGVSAMLLPELKLNRVRSYELKPCSSPTPCSLLTMGLPNMPEMTPRSLERWQVGLKLIWMGEDDDDLVAEVRHGSSFIFGTPRMPKVPEENEPADPGESSSPTSAPANSPVNVAVTNPTRGAGADCAVTSVDGESGKAAVAGATTDGVEAEKMKSTVKESVEQAREVLHVVDRMLSGLKSARRGETSHVRVASSEDLALKVQAPPKTSSGASPVTGTPPLSSIGRRRATLHSMKSQLEKLEELVASNASRLRPKGTGSETARRAELEWAILQDVRIEVDRLELELLNNSSPPPADEGRCVGNGVSQHISCEGNEETVLTEDGRKGQTTQKPASHNTGLSNKRNHRFPKAPEPLPCDDDVLIRRKAGRRMRRNPRAAGVAHRQHRSCRRHPDKGRAGSKADRATVMEGLRKAHVMLSDRMGTPSPKVLSVRIPTPDTLPKRASDEVAKDESLLGTPTLQPVPPDLCRKGTVMGASPDAACALRGEEHASIIGSPMAKSPSLKSTSSQYAKTSVVNKGAGGGSIRRIFLTF